MTEFLYPFLDAGETDVATVLRDAEASTVQKGEDVIALRRALDLESVEACGRAMRARLERGGRVIAFGNGGSSTDAQDLVVDFSADGWPALALNDDIATVTGVGNDVGFDNVFSRQLIPLARPADTVVGISTSGSSPNVLAGLEQAHQAGLLTCAIGGYGGGRFRELDWLDHLLVAQSDYVPRLQEAHATIYHLLLDVVGERAVRYVDEYRSPDAARRLSAEIATLVEPGRHYKVMEVCGGHTHTIYKHGVEDVLPPEIDLVHGPGCPVCVIPMGRVDDAIALAERPNVVFTTFGDMMRVPGAHGSLLDAKARGADVRMVYSPLDALKIARENRDRDVVFFAIGFETTAPSTALTLLRARDEGISNFFVFCNHVTIIPAIRAILDSPDLRLDGFVGPGHVSTVIGTRPYSFIARDYRKPLVVAGFEPLDVLHAVHMILRQLADRRSEVENQYRRVVREEGNARALEAIAETMELRTTFEWRGLGFISQSALKLSDRFAEWDAELRFDVPGMRVADPKACQCGEVLKGVIKPWECKVFGTACTPERPIGTCMVSSEGACAAYYNYGRFTRRLDAVPA